MSSTLSTVNTNVKNLMSSGSGVVKSVQRGVASSTSSSSSVTISSVNISKSIVITSGDGIGTDQNGYSTVSYAFLQSSTKLILSHAASRSDNRIFYTNVVWQVIEFY